MSFFVFILVIYFNLIDFFDEYCYLDCERTYGGGYTANFVNGVIVDFVNCEKSYSNPFPTWTLFFSPFAFIEEQSETSESDV